MNEKPLVIFTYVEAGLGHIIPATAISEAFKIKYGGQCEIKDYYIFSNSQHQLVKDYAKELSSWTKLVSKNAFIKHFEKCSYLLPSKLTLKFLDWKFKKVKELVIEDLHKLNPDLIFSTYYSPSHFAIEANIQKKTNAIIATYTPDPIVYPAWDKRGDLFFVNNDNARAIAERKKFKKDSIFQVPFMLKKSITEMNHTKQEARKILGLQDRFTVLIASGAYGMEKDKKIIKRLIEKDLDINIVCICGKNEELYKYYSNLDLTNSKTKFHVVGFTQEMQNYLAASDLMLGKSGANAMVEAFYFNIPFIVTSHSNALEKSICNYYIKKLKCGEKIFNVNKVADRVEQMFLNKDELESYSHNLSQFHDTSGAEQVADILFEKLKEKFNLKENENDL